MELSPETKVKIFNELALKILEIEERFYNEYDREKLRKSGLSQEDVEDKLGQWDSIFFDYLELLAFNTNREYISYEDVVDFFGEFIIKWQEAIPLNPEYNEFRKLYNFIKDRKRIESKRKESEIGK